MQPKIQPKLSLEGAAAVGLTVAGFNAFKDQIINSKGEKSDITRLALSMREGGLTDISRVSQVRPLVLVDQTLRGEPVITDVMQTTMSIFTAYYLQAASLITNVGKVNTLKVLSALNPDQGVRDVVQDKVWSTESYTDGLPDLTRAAGTPNSLIWGPALEADLTGGNVKSGLSPSEAKELVAAEPIEDPNEGDGSFGISDSTTGNFIKEANNLAIGKMVEVQISDGDKSAKFPVMIRAVPSYVPAEVLAHIFTAHSRNTSFKERWYLMKAGQIRPVRDLILNIDLIDEHKRALVNDTSNAYSTVQRRGSGSMISSILRNRPSMAAHSNIMIVSAVTAKAIEKELRGKLSNLRTRKPFFEHSYMMLMVIVDPKWDRVTIYHRGLVEASEFTFKEIQIKERGKGPDITEILKAYTMGATPTL